MAKEETTNSGDEQLAEMQLLAAQNAALETAITEKDKENAVLRAEVQQLKSDAEKSSVGFVEKPVERVIPADTVEVKGVTYRSKRAAFWHGTQKVLAVDFVTDKSFFAELVALYPSEFIEVD